MINRKQFPQFLAPYCIAFETSVGAIVFRIINNEVQYLLLKYRNGHWEFPRGKVEDHESEEETMKREIMEETGITNVEIVENFRQTMRFSYAAQGTERIERMKDKSCIYIHKKAIFYLAKTEKGETSLSHEHQNAMWLPFDEALKKLTYDNAKKILTAADKKMIKN